ncbi:MAG: hypothetical protein RBS08_01235 [Bdellovibrionales bacterium]|jgi:hypothetical protein|nr:hypothetical protein [Bdellovibrionales bacterium]
MEKIIANLKERIETLQDEIEHEIDSKREAFRYKIEQRRVVFEHEVAERHRALRMKISKFLRTSKIGYIVTAPVIYSLIIPFSLMDLFVTVYQHICFRVYGIPLVKRSEYVVMDRKYLSYLNWIEKLNCIYCEYGNGVIAYTREVAGRTEQFWCPIKHAKKIKDAHSSYLGFIEYGDSEDFHAKMENQRDRCRACEQGGGCGTGISTDSAPSAVVKITTPKKEDK